MSIPSFTSYLLLERNYSPHTVHAYEKDVLEFKDFCELHLDLMDIDEASYALIRNWIVALVESGISNRSVNRKISSLKAYYKFILGIGKLSVNPLATHRTLKVAKKLEIPFSETEMENVFLQTSFEDTFEGKRD